MDIRLLDANPTAEERAAVDAVLGPPRSGWDGGERRAARDTRIAHGGRELREQRTLLLPALQVLQSRAGWVSAGGLNYVCERLGVPPAEAWSVATFYALLSTSPRPRRVVHVCDDIGCRARGAGGLCERLEREAGPPLPHGVATAASGWMRSPCLGHCDAGPVALYTEAGPSPREFLIGGITAPSVEAMLADASRAADEGAFPAIPQRGDPSLVLLRRAGVVDPASLEAYRSAGGYTALPRALSMGAAAVIREVEASGLVGRGGAAFPTARKWAAVRAQGDGIRHLVCNADESEPGTFKDSVLLCADPFAIVESMTIAAFAAGCTKGWLYVRAEYPLAFDRMSNALAQARSAGWLGGNIAGSGFSFDVEVRRGSGAYICGEETALFESIEGRRGEPRSKPPFPVEHGLFGRPTVVNNVETLANVPAIVLSGGAAFAARGTAQSTGTRLFCLSGNVSVPGVYEVTMGTTLRELLARAGGVPQGRKLQAVLLGGAAGTFLTPGELDLPLSLEGARAAGATLGSGVVMVFDDSVDLRDIVLRIASFFRDESCGQCVPCRVGTVRQEEALQRLARGCARGSAHDELLRIDEVGSHMRDASICGLGQTAYSAVESALRKFALFGPAPASVAPAPRKALLRQPESSAAASGVSLTIDGRTLEVPRGTTLLEASRRLGIEVPTLCYLATLRQANACRLCVVEVEGARVLVPGCSREVEPGMVVHTNSERVRHSRRLVLELLGSSVDLSTAPGLAQLQHEYGCDPARFGPAAAAGDRDTSVSGHHEPTTGDSAATVAQPVKLDNDLYVRDYAKCVLCYKCVEACGEDHQNTFAIAVAGRGFDARISTELNVPLPESACVYCGNCIAVCPTGALMVKTEFDLRAAGQWRPGEQTVTETICAYCGVGCPVQMHEQDGRLVKATSPFDSPITQGNLCVKGRFGWQFVQPREGRSKD